MKKGIGLMNWSIRLMSCFDLSDIQFFFSVELLITRLLRFCMAAADAAVVVPGYEEGIIAPWNIGGAT